MIKDLEAWGAVCVQSCHFYQNYTCDKSNMHQKLPQPFLQFPYSILNTQQFFLTVVDNFIQLDKAPFDVILSCDLQIKFSNIFCSIFEASDCHSIIVFLYFSKGLAFECYYRFKYLSKVYPYGIFISQGRVGYFSVDLFSSLFTWFVPL